MSLITHENNDSQVAIPSLPSAASQNPFLPVEIPTGPAFLDTAACLCAFRETPVSNSHDALWECIGNQTERISITKQGKWFMPIHNDTLVNPGSPIWDGSNGPDVDTPLMYDGARDTLVPFNPDSLTIYDSACTGVNQTTFTTAFHRAAADLSAGLPPVDAMPCWLGPKALPMQIMTPAEWQRTGCPAGFLCANNTINSLPQYCPPVAQCVDGRNAGLVCQSQDLNIGMGPFEPVVCQIGYYCPAGGTQRLLCPEGHFCQAGTVQPTACSRWASCPPGSKAQASWAPLVGVCVLDLCLVTATLLFSLGGWMKKRRAAAGNAHKELAKFSDQDGSNLGLAKGATDIEAAVGGDRAADENSSPHLAAFVESMRRATQDSQFGLSFRYTNLSYHPPSASLPILRNITGSIERGSLTAVMGGSGAGKSTFINVLMGKLTNSGGTVIVNNVAGSMEPYQKLIGYVPQDDILLPELTIRENILHSARIRLPKNWTDGDIQAHVDAVINCLELTHVQHSQIGTIGKLSISGGQRKRSSIGMELAAAPMAMFLDEPTSGLDATAALAIMRTLRATARLGVSVVVTIHQPRTEIMTMLDELILLAEGQVVYHGPESFVRDHLCKLGYQISLHENSGDAITDIITGNGRAYKAEGEVSTGWLVANSAPLRNVTKETENSAFHRNQMPKNSILRYLPPLLQSLLPDRTLHDPALPTTLRTRGASRLYQTYLCLHRALLQQHREPPSLFWAEIALACLPGLLLGLSVRSRNGELFHGLYHEPLAILSPALDLASTPQLSLLAGVAMGLLAAAPGVRVFSEEILFQRREAAAGHSQGAYFAAKVLATLPRMGLACLHFTVVLLFLARLVAVPWRVAFAAHLAYFWCVYGVAAVVAMVVRREDAPLLATMVSLVLGIVCGAAPSLAKVAEWRLLWLWRASPAVWLTELYFGELVRPYGYLYQTELAARVMGLGLSATARNLAVLVALGFGYRLVAFVGLLYGGRLRV